MTLRVLVAALALALSAGACTGGGGVGPGDGDAAGPDGGAAPPAISGGGDETVCPAGATASAVTCLTVAVPLDHDEPDSGTVDLAVAFVDNDGTVTDAPVVFLNGGPGGGVVYLASAFVGLPFDVVAVDLRGTGGSRPSLDCPEIDEAFVELVGLAVGDAADARHAELTGRCRSRLASDGVDLDAFDTAATAADVVYLRTALGYDVWNLWGSSYGTWVALEVLRSDPGGVRSVVLDGTLPPEVDFVESIPSSAARAIAELASACADDTGCADRFGDSAATAATAAAALDDDPILVEALRPVSGRPLDVLVDGATFYAILFDLLYDTGVIGRLPLLIERAAGGELTELVQRFVDGRDPEVLEFSEAVYDAVLCADDLPFSERSEMAEALDGRDDAFVAAFDTGPLFEDCDELGVEVSGPRADEPVISDVPVLLVTGRFDPVTPPAWTHQAAANLSRSTVVELADRGHDLAISDSCTAGIMAAFLADPGASPDLGCVDTAPGPRWDTG